MPQFVIMVDSNVPMFRWILIWKSMIVLRLEQVWTVVSSHVRILEFRGGMIMAFLYMLTWRTGRQWARTQMIILFIRRKSQRILIPILPFWTMKILVKWRMIGVCFKCRLQQNTSYWKDWRPREWWATISLIEKWKIMNILLSCIDIIRLMILMKWMHQWILLIVNVFVIEMKIYFLISSWTMIVSLGIIILMLLPVLKLLSARVRIST